EQLKTTIRTFRKNRRAVINGAKMSYSNGCLEGVNRKIKQIERKHPIAEYIKIPS
ncbi:transposase, partial [Lactobacillus delbrueckii]|uniref:transposase n=1 Tax=Lactobacillus delbrueckii TaxID=1584 RepID=UPI001E624706